MKVRIKFSKTGNLRFVGHLDFMRYFQKAVRRANIPIKYSEGFSPHQIMSFASPLGIGAEGCGEYMDIELAEGKSISSEAAVQALNAQMCEGARVLRFLALPEQAKNGMSLVSSADYRLYIPEQAAFSLREHLEKAITELLAAEEVKVEKESKGGLKEVDIRPMIEKVFCIQEGEGLCLYMRLACGSSQNVKPEAVWHALGKINPQLLSLPLPRMQRQELYAENGLRLEDYGEEIV